MKTVELKSIGLTAVGIVISVATTASASADTNQRNNMASLQMVQSAIIDGRLILSPRLPADSAVGKSHAVKIAQSCPSGSGHWYSGGGNNGCVQGFAQ